ncbi:AraC family transcriptional regulator [Chitinophagaceae bacterium 26-R-25]|nr:AraC family transcriptional regulator [Chitinophagaceae bacterium 26-R-25]
MQYIYENFTFPPDQSFTIRRDIYEPKMYTSLKSHINFEIALIENCVGKRFIGDNIEDFEGAELVLLGSYLPHCWQFYKVIEPTSPTTCIVIHFFPDFLGKQLLERPEAKHLHKLFNDAAKGVHFSGATITQAKILMEQMLCENGLSKAALMLRLLDLLSSSASSKVLSSPFFNIIENSAEAQKIDKVFDYIFENFRKEIALTDVANIAHMSPAAFCRFFKSKTNRTLIDFVNEVRIGHAAKLLIEGKHNITEACFNSGYNNLSNFNKHFRNIKGMSPRDFLKQYNTDPQDLLLETTE